MKGFFASPRLLLLAALALPGLASAQDAAPAAEASTRIDGIFVDVTLPVALAETDITQRRIAEQSFRFEEIFGLQGADAGRVQLAIQLRTFSSRDPGEVGRIVGWLRDELVRQRSPDEVREVQVAGRSFHMLRHPPLSAEGVPVRGGDGGRVVDVLGSIDDVLLQVTLLLPASLADQEAALADALAAMVIDVPALLAERDAFLAASADGASHPTVFGSLDHDGSLRVSVMDQAWQREVASGAERGAQKLFVIAPSATGAMGAVLELGCERAGDLPFEVLETRIDGSLHANYAAPLSDPEATRLGPLEGARRLGRSPASPDAPAIQRISRIATSGDAVYFALVDSMDAPETVARLEAWLEEQAVPACPGRFQPRTRG